MLKESHNRQQHRKKILFFFNVVCVVLVVAIGFFAVKAFIKYSNEETAEVLPQDDSEDTSQYGQISSSDLYGEYAQSQGLQTDTNTDTIPEQTPAPVLQPDLAPVTAIPPELLVSTYGYMIRTADGAVVLDKRSDERMYPASMTKVMSMLVFLDYLTDMDQKFEVTWEILDPLYEEGSSMAGFAAGELVSVEDLMYGTLLPSGGDACTVLACAVAGSIEGFADLMNQKAAELNLTGTHFMNPTGLDDPDQYTTCKDMAAIFEAALENEIFYQMITARSHTCESTDQHPEGLTFGSSMFAYITDNVMDNGAVILGGKTGTTDAAGYCLASFGAYNGQTYILVTALAPFSQDGMHGNITDAITAYSLLA